jgi:hypothetical protein
MKAQQTVHDGRFGPDDLALLDMVFAGAWKQIEQRFADDEIPAAREWLASIVVTLGRSRLNDGVKELQDRAITIFNHGA